MIILVPAAAAGQEQAASGPAPLVLTLDKAVSLALSQNRDVLIASQDRTRADAQIKEALSGVFPSISVSGVYTRNIQMPVLFLPPNSPINPSNSTARFELGSSNAYTLGASLTQTLYDKRVGVGLDIARTYRDYVSEAYRGTEEEVTLAVTKAFYGVLLTQKLVEVARQSLEIVKANFENIQSQYRNGTVAEYDMLRAEVEVANTEPLLISAENAFELAKNALKNLLALPIDQEIEAQGSFAFEDISDADLQRARQEAPSRNPFIRGLALSETIQEKNILVERAALFPTLKLVGAYSWQTQDNSFDLQNYQWAQTSSLGLLLSFPLFDGARTNSRVREARSDYEKIRLAKIQAEEALSIQIQSAELRMAEARKRVEGQKKSIDQAQRAVQIAQTRFTNGVGTQLELLDSRVALTRAQSTLAMAAYDYLVAKADWQFAVGLSR